MCLIYNVILLQNHRHNLLTRHWLLSSRIAQQRGVPQGSNPEGFEQKNCRGSQREKTLGGGFPCLQPLCTHIKQMNLFHWLQITLGSIMFFLPFQGFSQYYPPFQLYRQSTSWVGKTEGQKGRFSLRNYSRQENWIDTERSLGFSASQIQFGPAVLSDVSESLEKLF